LAERILERDKLVVQVLENSLRVEDVQEEPGIICVPMQVKR
jgi:hypothetical protein